MSSITDTLVSAWIPKSVVDTLQSSFGDKLENELVTNGLKSAAEKVGIDASTLPDIDFQNGIEAVQELMGTDVDHDGKTGVSEAIENIQEMAKNTDMTAVSKSATGMMAKLRNFFNA